MSNEKPRREPILDPIERVSEMCFGLFMALTFVGAVSVATGGRDEGRMMLAAALGCNLAWGLVDAVMYLVRTITNRGRERNLAIAAHDAPGGGALAVPERPRLEMRDYTGAVGIFFIVVLSTFPVALPFVLMSNMANALLVSRILSLAMLFGGGIALGRYAGYGGYKAGFTLMGVGMFLTAAIIALGG
ncbi:hypothetical protein [Usitatibacter palustris]|uniref:VIT family protein n=1 Tax=Usitatibacter palustris TaxID=2732487 RepID=A0A6M4H2U0_9PROT|nr:hypothetical protein [Usitatibacter palustris]QJR13645.1 hypothetical protein DSM104440_00430 [Usitatibacter palustris]